MDSPLQDCSIEEQRGLVRFLWAEGVKPVEIHRRMLAQLLPGFGAERLSHLRSSEGGVARSEIRFR